MARRYRVLAIAEAANPEWVSVPLIGWSLARALAKVADVHLVTQVRNREAILRAGLVEGDDFTAIDTESVAGPLWRAGEAMTGGSGKGWTALQAAAALSYPTFERKVRAIFGDALRGGAYDIVHRITPLSPTAAGPLAGYCRRVGVPFVIGPLNGGVPWPPGFDRVRREEREWLSYLRGAARLLPRRRRTFRNATALIAGSRHTCDEVAALAAKPPVYIPENAVQPDLFPQATPPEGPLRAAHVGRLVPYKGADILIEAAAPLLRAGRMHIDIIGDGPMHDRLAARIAEESLGQAVTLHGWIDHANVQRVLGRAHVLAFPSVREFGGGVVLEAMAMGVVPVVADYAGPAELVDDATGYRVPFSNRKDLVRGFRARLSDLCEDPSPLAAMARAARNRVASHFTWAAKARQILEVYDWATGARADRPEPFAFSAPADSQR